MSEKYVTYKLWDGCSAPSNLERGSRLVGHRVSAMSIDRDELLRVADEIERADVDGCVGWHERIRKACGIEHESE